MVPSTAKDSGAAERERLLPNGNGVGETRPGYGDIEAGPSRPRWKIWPWSSRGISLEDEHLDDSSSYAERIDRHQRQAKQIGIYALLILLGIAVGRALSKVGDVEPQKGHGPMVPPIFKLPPPTGLPRNDAYLIEAKHGAVASEEETCSNLGVSILRDLNGTAVDAAVTTTLCIGLLNAFSSGIGGGGFMVVKVPDDAPLPGCEETEAGIWAIDFRETSPRKSKKSMYGEKKAGRAAAQVGGLAVGVPGELRGLEMAHKMYGRLKWEDVVMPVAELAQGWRVGRELARRLRIFGQFMLESPAWREVYAPQGYLLVEGDFVRRTTYGQTLETIAKHGVQAFYEGDIAESAVRTIQESGGILDLEDLREYKALKYPAIHQTYNGKTIYTTNAPSSGGVMLGVLNILETYNISTNGCLDSTLNTHRLVEAMKFGFGARSEITDPAFASNQTRLNEFYDKQWAAGVRPLMTDDMTHDFAYYGLQHDTPVDHGTTHLSVVDQWGGAASVTSTVNLIWGSHVMDPRTGVIFNDEQDDFAVPGAPDAFGLLPSPWNYPAPGKKPLSSTAATVILNDDGSLYAVLGGSGGSRIFPSVVQVILNLECGLNISAAIERPRIHNQIFPLETQIEVGPEGSNDALVKGLKAKGHNVTEFDINIGIAEIQGIMVEEGKIWASSDSRKNGIAAGY